jgi:lysine 2,3-aminomutase
MSLDPKMGMHANTLQMQGPHWGARLFYLNGINDDPLVLKSFVYGLLKTRVRPCYMYQCDPIPEASGFSTPVANGLELFGVT